MVDRKRMLESLASSETELADSHMNQHEDLDVSAIEYANESDVKKETQHLEISDKRAKKDVENYNSEVAQNANEGRHQLITQLPGAVS